MNWGGRRKNEKFKNKILGKKILANAIQAKAFKVHLALKNLM